MNSLPAASSITHQHIASILNTQLETRATGPGTVRILDLGCGEGKFISYLVNLLPVLRPGIGFEVFGLDVNIWKLLENKGKPFLRAQHPNIDWESRLAIISPEEKWPYPDESFDFITSNQVMEHVKDYGFVFQEIHRCLRPDGLSINLFPVYEVLWEAHVHMPVVHRIKNLEKRARYIRFFAGIGFTRRYEIERRRRSWQSLDEFADDFAKILEKNTNYINMRELSAIAKQTRLRIAFTYTKDFFLAKMLSLVGKRYHKYRNRPLTNSFALFFAKRLSSITVLLNKSL